MTNIYDLTTSIACSRCFNTCGSLKTAAVCSKRHIAAVKPTVQLVGKKLVCNEKCHSVYVYVRTTFLISWIYKQRVINTLLSR